MTWKILLRKVAVYSPHGPMFIHIVPSYSHQSTMHHMVKHVNTSGDLQLEVQVTLWAHLKQSKH